MLETVLFSQLHLPLEPEQDHVCILQMEESIEQKNTDVFELFDLLDYTCDLFCIFKYAVT